MVATPKKQLTDTQLEIRQTIGELIKSTRLSRDMSQAAVGERVGLCAEMISRYERGTSAITFDVFLNIANALSLPLCEAFKVINESFERSK